MKLYITNTSSNKYNLFSAITILTNQTSADYIL